MAAFARYPDEVFWPPESIRQPSLHESMTSRALKLELWLSLSLACASAVLLGFLLVSVARDRFPEVLVPLVELFFGSKENLAVAGGLGIKLGMASVSGLLLSITGFVHCFWIGRQLVNSASSNPGVSVPL